MTNIHPLKNTTLEKKITLIFVIVATSLVLFYVAINWIGWYYLSGRGIDATTYPLFNISFSQWQIWTEQTRMIHLYLCIIFSIIIGILYLCRRFSLKEYFCYNLYYFLGQVIIVYIAMGIFDPSGITGGFHYLCAIPYRYYRWGFIILIGLIGFVINKFRKKTDSNS